MALLDGAFDASTIDPTQAFSALPAGRYPVIVESSEMKHNKNSQGQHLLLMLQIIDGEHKGKKLFDRLNLENPNKTAVEIANRQLSALCRAARKMQIKDSVEVHNIPIIAVVKHKPASGDYGASNDIQTYEPTEASAPAGTAHTEAPAANQTEAEAPANDSGKTKAPWEK